MIDYIEIEDPKELARLNRSLSSKLTKGFRHSELRNIGYPAGNFSAEVRFSSPAGNDVFWWRGNPSSDNLMAHNMFGRGTPGAHYSLNIDLQLNFPVVEFSRKSGGAFLRHTPTNTVVLAQRGIVTLGHGRVQKSVLFAEMTVTRRDVDTSSGPREFLLIGELDSPTLVHDIQSFASELRQRVRAIKDDHPPTGRRRPSSVSRPSTKVPTKLRQYFDEFSGYREIKRRQKGIADCYHGTVVRAVRDALPSSAKILKNRDIDLFALTTSKALIFEVKTSADTQSIYTAIGQLSVHAPAVKQKLGGKPLLKIVVLPEQPSERLRTVLADKLKLHVLTFTRLSDGKVRVNGLSKLM